MRGHLRERSPGHLAIVIDVRDPAPASASATGTPSWAPSARPQVESPELIASVGKGAYVEPPTRSTVAEFVRGSRRHGGKPPAPSRRGQRSAIDNWSSTKSHRTSAQSRCRSFTRLDVEEWHTTLAPRWPCLPHHRPCAPRCLSKALGDAERDGAVVKGVCKLQKAPRVTESEMVIVQDVARPG